MTLSNGRYDEFLELEVLVQIGKAVFDTKQDRIVSWVVESDSGGLGLRGDLMGRFLGVDPLTKDYPFYTPYQFAGNTPIWAIDLEGKQPHITTNDVVVGYWVQVNQGLTYIEKDIKENYAACMNTGNKDWDWTSIREWNNEHFSKVKGDPNDKYNQEYIDGNGVIHPNQYLDLSFTSKEAAIERYYSLPLGERERYMTELETFLVRRNNDLDLFKTIVFALRWDQRPTPDFTEKELKANPNLKETWVTRLLNKLDGRSNSDDEPDSTWGWVKTIEWKKFDHDAFIDDKTGEIKPYMIDSVLDENGKKNPVEGVRAIKIPDSTKSESSEWKKIPNPKKQN